MEYCGHSHSIVLSKPGWGGRLHYYQHFGNRFNISEAVELAGVPFQLSIHR